MILSRPQADRCLQEHSSNRVYAKVTLPDANGKKLTGKHLFNVLDAVCKYNAVVLTDDYSGYGFFDDEKRNPNNYIHISVNQSRGQYSAGKGTTQTALSRSWHCSSVESWESIIISCKVYVAVCE